MATAIAHTLGPLGTLLHVNAPTLDAAGGPEPVYAFVVDRSGSMGPWSTAIVNRALPAALKSLGCAPATRVHLITFDTDTRYAHLPVSQLPSVDAASTGGTTMAPALRALCTRVFGHVTPHTPLALVVVSDGAVADMREVLAEAARCAAAVRGRPAPVGVTLVRLMTSEAQPDTRALSCLGVLDTMPGRVPVVDVPVTDSLANVVAALVRALHAGMARASHRCLVLRTPGLAALSRMPGEAGASELHVPHDAWVLVAAAARVECGSKGELLAVSERRGEPQSEHELAGFLDYVDSHVRMLCVAADGGDVATKAAVAWCAALATALSAAVVPATTSLNVRDRARALAVRVRSQGASVLRALAEMGNATRVSSLNAAQQADFLRGDLRSARTAKRALQRDGELDYDGLCRDALRAWTPCAVTWAADPNASYVSLATWGETMEAVGELSGLADHVTAQDLLTVLGGLGVPFRGRRGDLPDPWAFRVEAVYAGGMYLSEADLRYAAGSGGEPIMYPGTKDAVNGVVPLCALDPRAYARYHAGAMRGVAELQASVTLRGALARVPYDVTARDAAVYVLLVRRGAVTEAERFIAGALREQLAAQLLAAPAFAPLAAALGGPRPGAYLTGDMGVSGVTKPLALLLATAHAGTDAPAFQRALRAVYTFEAYHGARAAYRNDEAARTRDLHAVLGIEAQELARAADVGAPFSADAPFAVRDVVDVGAFARAAQLPWMPAVDEYARMGLAEPLERGVVLAAALEALACSQEEERVDRVERTVRGPVDGPGAAVYALKAYFSVFRAVYDRAIAAKRAAERAERLRAAIEAMASADTLDAFVPLLCAGVANRSAPGYAELEQRLVVEGRDSVPLAPAKLFVLITGRHPHGAHDVVWNLGNVAPGGWNAYERYYDGLPVLWTQLCDIRAAHGVHQYRASDKPNRHRHCNSHPSFAAFNFASLDAYRASVTSAAWAEYAGKHARCCGFVSLAGRK